MGTTRKVNDISDAELLNMPLVGEEYGVFISQQPKWKRSRFRFLFIISGNFY
jgi:hypothetical protein